MGTTSSGFTGSRVPSVKKVRAVVFVGDDHDRAGVRVGVLAPILGRGAGHAGLDARASVFAKIHVPASLVQKSTGPRAVGGAGVRAAMRSLRHDLRRLPQV